MTASCVRSRASKVADGRGGWYAGVAVTATYPCRVNVLNTRVVIALDGARKDPNDRVTVSLPFDADVQPEDSLAIAGVVYRVLGTDAGRTDMTMLSAECEVVL